MRLSPLALLLASALLAPVAHAQTQAAPAAATASQPAPQGAAQPWRYKTARLKAADVDALLARPEQLLVLDIRRPDELIKYGSFPVYLNIQFSELEQQLAYLPRDRVILTVSNRAQRAGRAGDLLALRGFKVAGATGSEDYELEGGKAVKHLQPPPPRVAAAGTP